MRHFTVIAVVLVICCLFMLDRLQHMANQIWSTTWRCKISSRTSNTKWTAPIVGFIGLRCPRTTNQNHRRARSSAWTSYSK